MTETRGPMSPGWRVFWGKQGGLNLNDKELQQEQTGVSRNRPQMREGWAYLWGVRCEMNVIEGVVDVFIMTMGITPPKPEQKRAATIFIATGLFGTIAGVLVLVGIVIQRIGAH